MDFKSQLQSALVIEQQALAQSHIRNSLYQIGFDDVDLADRSNLAIKKIEQKNYDLILCAYDLDKGADGYQLFEKLTKKGLIKSSTSFIFTCSENNLQLTQSVIELNPDDFLLKPFTAKELELRLNRVLLKKITLRPVLQEIDVRNYKTALAKLNDLISENNKPRWVPLLMKLKGEIILAMQHWPVAEVFFQKVLTVKSYNWAQLGLIQSLIAQSKFEQAREYLELMLSKPQTRLEALDILAELDKQDHLFEAAMANIKQAVTLSPRNIERQKKLVELARLAHDYETQYHASNSIIRHVQHSIHETPEIYLSAVRSAIDYGLTTFNQDEINKVSQNSQTILSNIKKRFPGVVMADQIDVAQARIFNLKNETDKAKQIMADNLEKIAEYQVENLEDALDKAKAFHELGFHRDSEKLFDEIERMCSDFEHDPVFSEYIKNEKQLRIEIKESPKELNNRAVHLFQQGRLLEALDAFKTAFKVMPKNPSIALNLMQTIIESNAINQHPEESAIVIELCKNAITGAKLTEDQHERFVKLLTLQQSH